MRTIGATRPASPPGRRWRSGLSAVAAALLAAGTLVAATGASASAATVDTSAWYVLVNRNSGNNGHLPGPVDGTYAESGITTWTKGEVLRFFSQF